MLENEEPSYLAFARSNVRLGYNTSIMLVKELIARIDRDAVELERLRKVSTDA